MDDAVGRPGFAAAGYQSVFEAALGNRDAALDALDSLWALYGSDKALIGGQYNIFAIHTYDYLGMYDELLDVLEKDVKEPGWLHAAWLKQAYFDEVRDHPRFREVMRKYEAWQRPE